MYNKYGCVSDAVTCGSPGIFYETIYSMSCLVYKENGKLRVRRDAEDQEVEDVINSYTYGGELSDEDRDALSPAMKELCQGKPIKWLKQLHDTVSAHEEEPAGEGRPTEFM